MLAVQHKGIMQATQEGANKLALIRQFSNLTPKKIIENNYPNLHALKKQYSVEKVEEVTRYIIADLAHSFGGELDQSQIEELVLEVNCSTLANMSLEDVYYACRTIKLDKQFGKLNVNKVMTVLEEHFSERCELYMELERNKDIRKLREPAPPRTQADNERIKAHVDKILSKYKDQNKKPPVSYLGWQKR